MAPKCPKQTSPVDIVASNARGKKKPKPHFEAFVPRLKSPVNCQVWPGLSLYEYNIDVSQGRRCRVWSFGLGFRMRGSEQSCRVKSSGLLGLGFGVADFRSLGL